MPPCTGSILALWKEGRTRSTKQLPKRAMADLPKRLEIGPNSVGFLARQIGDV